MILTPQLDPNGPDLTVDEAGEILGLSERTMYRYLTDKEFPGAWKTRGAWRIPQATVIEYISTHTPEG